MNYFSQETHDVAASFTSLNTATEEYVPFLGQNHVFADIRGGGGEAGRCADGANDKR